MQMEKEMEIEKETETETETEMHMEMEMEMEMETEIFGAWKASSELRFASKWFLTPDFEVLEASEARRGDQERPKKPPRRPQ